MRLGIVDRWERERPTFVPFSFFAPTGIEEPLDLIALDVIGADDTGKAVRHAVVKNTTAAPIIDVFVLARAWFDRVRVRREPDGVAIPGAATRP